MKKQFHDRDLKSLIKFSFSNLNLLKRIRIKNLLLASLFTLVSLGIVLFAPSVNALDIPLTGLSTGTGTNGLLSGTACSLNAKYRYASSATLNGQALDLLVEITGIDNEFPRCISLISNLLSVRLKDNDATNDSAFVDLKLTVVQQGTQTAVNVDRLALIGFDLDSTTGTGTDDIYFKSPSASYISNLSNVAYSNGDFGGGFNTKLKGQTSGNCDDGQTVPAPACRAGAIFTGTGNNISTVDIRIQNDNAFGTSTSTTANRLAQISLLINDLVPILDTTVDRGDAPATYGDAGHKISPNIILGNGIPPDNDPVAQPSTNADLDDTIDVSTNKIDDEDGVKSSGTSLAGQSFTVGAAKTIDVTTFGAGKLSAWIDLNHDGDFSDPGEDIIKDTNITTTGIATNSISLSIPNTAFFGQSFIRFRYTTATGIASSDAAISTLDGEVEDYKINFVGPAKLVLVKRVTAIGGVDINTYQDNTDPSAQAVNDNNQFWPLPLNTSATLGDTNISSFLRGAINTVQPKPGDKIEYTIYFLSSGGNNISSVRICDPIKGKQTYVANSMKMLPAGASIPIDLTDLSDSNDRASSYLAGAAPNDCNASNSTATGADNGGVTVQLVGTGAGTQPNLPQISGTTGPGTPTTSYGWFRFTTIVAP